MNTVTSCSCNGAISPPLDEPARSTLPTFSSKKAQNYKADFFVPPSSGNGDYNNAVFSGNHRQIRNCGRTPYHYTRTGDPAESAANLQFWYQIENWHFAEIKLHYRSDVCY